MIIDSSGHVGHPVNVDAVILSSAAGFIKGGAHRHPPCRATAGYSTGPKYRWQIRFLQKMGSVFAFIPVRLAFRAGFEPPMQPHILLRRHHHGALNRSVHLRGHRRFVASCKVSLISSRIISSYPVPSAFLRGTNGITAGLALFTSM